MFWILWTKTKNIWLQKRKSQSRYSHVQGAEKHRRNSWNILASTFATNAEKN